MSEHVLDRWFPRVAACGSTVQARARSNCREPISAKTSVPWAVCVTPLPARVLPASKVFNVTWRRQGWWDLFACLKQCGTVSEWSHRA